MSFAEKSFDWRSFWADLLGGAGRGLLEMDNSEAARAALSGMDFMEAARQRRRKLLSEDDVNAGHDLAPRTYLDAGNQSRVAESADDPGNDERGLSDHRKFVAEPQTGSGWRSVGGAQAGLPLSVRPAPLFADPYEDPGLPARLRVAQYNSPRRR